MNMAYDIFANPVDEAAITDLLERLQTMNSLMRLK